MQHLGSALILSPFATYPLDAGQRKRAYQTTKLLQSWGFSITFLHFAFETRWYWGHNRDDDLAIREQWAGDVLHFYANKNVGLPPINSVEHQLDEWWDESLGGYISNIFSKRTYDVFVVHNLWLSKAFDYAPYHCLKVLDMHDLFSQRAQEFYATGAKPEFFYCSETDEIYGLKRADLLLAIKEEDASWCTSNSIRREDVITIPYSEECRATNDFLYRDPPRAPISPGKVIFGMIGSDIHFNRHSAHLLLKELELAIKATFAPIEFVLAGSLCRAMGQCPKFVRKMGFVDDVSSFYSSVDIVIVPNLHGTGIKIKSMESISYGKPTLFTYHSAQGTGIEVGTFNSLSEMAQTAASIALSGVIPKHLSDAALNASCKIEKTLRDAKDIFIKHYRRKRPSFTHIIAPNNDNRASSILASLVCMSLYKQLASRMQSQGIAIHPSLFEYIPSVPGSPLPLVRDLPKLLDICEDTQLLVVQSTQLQLLDQISTLNRDCLVLADCRLSSSAQSLRSIIQSSPTHRASLAFIVSPYQATTLDEPELPHCIVMPIIDSRSFWDPHLSPNVQVVQDLLINANPLVCFPQDIEYLQHYLAGKSDAQAPWQDFDYDLIQKEAFEQIESRLAILQAHSLINTADEYCESVI